MNLKKLELFGFKSFAERTVIQFDQGITGIIGPNGSGKSNIADAVRWVLGEQSARILRGRFMEDVIFGGTETQKPLSYCEVIMVFDNSQGDWPNMGQEVSVSRRVYRSGESEYRLNKAPCRLKTIVDLFRDSGIGREGYSIIGQGRVDEILSHRAEDRRNIFHEAAGIMRYRTRKEEAEHRLEAAQNNLTRLGDVMKVLTEQLEPLAQQSIAARQYLEMSQDLKRLEVNRFLCEYKRIMQSQEETKANCTALKAILSQQENDLLQHQQQQESLHAQEEAAEENLQESRDALLSLTREEEQCRSSIELIQQRIAFLTQDQTKMEASLQHDESMLQETYEKANSLKHELIERKTKVSSMETHIHIQEQKLSALDKKIDDLEQALELRKQHYINSLSRQSNVKSEKARLETLRDSIEERILELQNRCQDYLERSTATQAELMQAQSSLASKQEHLLSVAGEREKAKASAAEIQRQIQIVTNEITKIREQHQTAKTRYKILQDMRRDYEGYNNTVKQLFLDAKNNPALEKCLDNVVAELIHVPRQYAIAVEVALGGALQNIVTATEEDAKLAIDYLRKKQLGRATFLPLTAVKERDLPPQQRFILNMQGCCGIASELISYNPIYHGIISSLLGRTVLAQNMDAAISMARKCGQSLRIVTLQGDMINAGGAMTGGSIRSKFTSILTRKKELEDLSSLLEDIQSQYQKAIQKEVQFKEEEAQFTKTLHTLEETYHSLSVEVAQQDSICQQLRKNQDRRKSHHAEAEEQLHQLQETRQQVMTDLDANLRHEDQLMLQDENLQVDVQQMQQNITELREDRDYYQDTFSASQGQYLADKRENELLDADLDKLNQQIAELSTHIIEKRLAYNNSKDEVPQLEKELREAESRAEAYRCKLSNVEKSLQTQLTQQATVRNMAIQLEQVISELAKENLRTSAKEEQLQFQLQRFTDEAAALQNRIWDTYEVTYAQAQTMAIQEFSLQESIPQIERLRRNIRALGQVNVRAVEDYAACKAQLEEQQKQWDDLTMAKTDLEKLIQSLSQTMREQFLENFYRIDKAFAKTFARLFGGGTAKLVLNDTMDVLESGIEIRVQPPGKKLQLLSLLSGGERALTAIALLFAMLDMHPTPFCILDEIEAALDEANIYNFTQYLKEYSQQTQFVIITHRKTTMEAADSLYGVTMQEKGVSKLLSVRMSDVVKEVS